MQAAQQRCAIYTRKSVVGRHDPEYNSIESQRDVCSAYITSQAHRGWRELALRYDDLGHSGGTLERPALNRLVADIEQGRIDVVVLYKIDRLTRSLRDFMRLLEVFELHGVGFISITQSFDTQDTLGRLILNILLTFAQFEREMHADRVRDKKRMMRQRGLWTGGTPPLGFTIQNGRVTVDEAEAKIVRQIFQRFIAVQNYNRVSAELIAQGVKTKRSTLPASNQARPISCSTVYAILQNPSYVNGWSLEGNEEAIIDPETWAAARAIAQVRAKHGRKESPNVLLGLLWDSYGRRMTVHDYGQVKDRYRYYVSCKQRLPSAPPIRPFRVASDELEELVKATIADFLCDRSKLRDGLLECGVHGLELERLSASGVTASSRLADKSSTRLRALLKAIIGRIELARTSVAIVVRLQSIECLLRTPQGRPFKAKGCFGERPERTVLLRVPIEIVRVERSLHLPDLEHRQGSNQDPQLVELMMQCRTARRLVEEKGIALNDVAEQLHLKSVSAVARRIRVTYLAPDICLAIMEGRQPPSLSRRKLLETNIPMDWALQRRIFGFPEQKPLQMGEARY